MPVESPEGVTTDTMLQGRGAGGPTGFLTTYSGGNLNAQANGGFFIAGRLGRHSVGRSGAGQGKGSVQTAQQAAADAALYQQGLVPAAMVNTPPVVTSVTASEPKPLNEADPAKAAEEERRDELRRKLHHSLFAVVERLQKKEAVAGADEAGFIRNGKAEVQIWLTEKSVANLAKLQELGFEVVFDAKNPRLIIGRLSIDKLEALASLTFVSYVSPQVSK